MSSGKLRSAGLQTSGATSALPASQLPASLDHLFLHLRMQIMAPAAVAASPCATRRQPSAAAAVAAAPPPCRVPPTAARFPQRCPYRRQQRSSTVAASAPEAATTAVSLPEPAAAELDAEGRRAWGACAELLAARCGLDREAANAALLKAFGWKGQGFWRQVGRVRVGAGGGRRRGCLAASRRSSSVSTSWPWCLRSTPQNTLSFMNPL